MEAGRALFVRAVSGQEESESKGEGMVGAAGGSSAGPRKTAPVDDRELLRGIYEALGGPEHWGTKWDLDQPINTLYGVTCDERGRVVKINLSENDLEGVFSARCKGKPEEGRASVAVWPSRKPSNSSFSRVPSLVPRR